LFFYSHLDIIKSMKSETKSEQDLSSLSVFGLKKPWKASFTLIELLVVIAIIGILSGLIVISMNGAVNSANDAKRKSNIDELRKALMMYNASNGTYPIDGSSSPCQIGNDSSCTVLDPILKNGYFPSIPLDPSGSYYTYQSTDGSSFLLSAILSSGSYYNYSSVSGVSTWACGNPVTFTYNGSSITYGTVVSQAGKCFLDRNLGATQVATSLTDTASYGDLFQWGRGVDGHQIRTSTTSSTLATSSTSAGSSFITNSATPYDWLLTQDATLWQGVSGTNNPCPSGWRLPTRTEWQAEITAGSWTTSASAYASPLKLPAAGARSYSSAALGSVGSNGYYWSSSVTGSNSYSLYFDSSSADMGNYYRACGFSVRCVRD
jgi:type II secretion system protein G